ncbi:hypothetical protein C2845_PM11G12310 [Panicum miliaceum]|uniref:DUF1618 domain-containing protein n=1 Tax=Panicum miliaceum TaxID=4540 RepID=A0A3L6RTC0_PANMI|nr:hypothetical protein C2845_PM11G12310 [Panicum miliaceum]
MYRGVSAIDAGRALKFVHVARGDDIGYGALKPGASFTITCYTLSLGGSMASMRWIKDSTATSDKLWASASGSPDDEFPHDIAMFPLVNIDRPHVVHFLISSYESVIKKMWLVAIDMNTRTVESFSQYLHGKEDLGTVDADLTRRRSTCPLPFLPCELSKYLHPSW